MVKSVVWMGVVAERLETAGRKVVKMKAQITAACLPEALSSGLGLSINLCPNFQAFFIFIYVYASLLHCPYDEEFQAFRNQATECQLTNVIDIAFAYTWYISSEMPHLSHLNSTHKLGKVPTHPIQVGSILQLRNVVHKFLVNIAVIKLPNWGAAAYQLGNISSRTVTEVKQR